MPLMDLARIGAGLPVAQTIDRLPALFDAPTHPRTLLIQAPPGTGKTTLVPPALVNYVAARAGAGGKVIVTAPRRVAVRAAARRLAHLDGSRVGERVGYSIRGEHRPGSLVEFVTPGVLLRRLLTDPELAGVAAVAIDEVHERQLDTDLALGMALELTQLREDFLLTAMSATLDADKFGEFLSAPVLSTPATTYPLTTEYHPHLGRMEGSREFYAHLAHLARSARERTGYSVLVFVPGVREVDAVLAHLPDGVPLHGRLAARDQDAALGASAGAKIIVATAIAESSLTVPGVRAVVDSGLSRVPRRDAARAMTGLVTVTAAQSTADQRAGRAGREGPGLVLRAYAESDYQHAPAHITPEIATADLTQAALWLACWGTPRGEGLALVDAPPAGAIAAAEEVLRELGAVGPRGEVTALGRSMARLPMHPRLARALLSCGPSAAEVIAVLADSPAGDIAAIACPRGDAARLRTLVSAGEGAWAGESDPGVITALAYPHWVARRENGGGGGEYLLASGTRAVLPPGSPLAGAPWLAVAEVTRTTSSGPGRAGAVIRAAARISPADAAAVVGVNESVEATLVGGGVRGRAVRRLGAIELSSTPVKVEPAQASAALAAAIRREGLALFSFSSRAQALRERLEFLHARLGKPWPDIADADPELWLGPELDAMAHGTAPGDIDMYPALQRLLPWPEASELDTLAPERLSVPSGSQPRISYATGRPVVRVKLQECFGLADSPTCAGVRVQFHLLSPAGRPLAVTDDLASFWSGPYAGVRAEMRGRYPKHPWPEDPWTAQATARAKNRGRGG